MTSATTSHGSAGDVHGRVPGTLVVPLDGSDYAERALPVARRFAAAFGADVTALTTPHSLDRTTWDETPAWLTAIVTEPSPVPVRGVVVPMLDPADAVQAEVTAHAGAAVCMATHARGPIGSGALGNLAQDVVRRVEVPVLLVGRHCDVDDLTDGPVVVAHDGSSAADAVLATARAWAHARDLPIVVVTVRRPLDGGMPAQHDRAIDEACRRLGPDARLEVVTASFAPGAIRDLAHELDASLIALTTHGHGAPGHFCVGRVASWVTRESACPVLLVRPRDFSG
jgi:nucleotide-binding universal stress UspA family protein